MIKAIRITGDKEQAKYLFNELTGMDRTLSDSVINIIIANAQYEYLILRQNDVVVFNREQFFMNYQFLEKEDSSQFVECEPHMMEWDIDLNIPMYTKDYINLYGDSARFKGMGLRV